MSDAESNPPATDAPPTAPPLRASDADRERVVAQLREHAAAGRLAPEELEERLDAAFGAKTVEQLEPLLRDLPELSDLSAAAPERSPERSAERALARRRLAQEAGGGAITIAICVAVWAATGASYFWPGWVMLAIGIALSRQAWRLLGPGAGLDAEELGDRRDHDARRAVRRGARRAR